MSSSLDEQAIDLLRELVSVYKLVNKPIVVQRLEEELSDPKQKLIYELSNGERSTREIAEIVGKISHSTIANYWKQWAKKGVMIPAEREGRHKYAVDLKEYGLDSYETEKA